MFGINSINGSVEWLRVPDFLRTNGPAWTANLLAPHPSWGGGGSTTNPNWGSKYGRVSGSVSVPRNRPVCVLPIFHRRISENMRTAAHRVCDNLLRGNRLERMQSSSTFRKPIRNWWVNRQDDDWDDLWYDPVDQTHLWRISVGSVSISGFSFLSVTIVSGYQLITFCIDFCVIFLWIVICRIVDCWLKRQYFKSFYRFCQNVQLNLPLICNACTISLCIGCDGGLTEIIHSKIIGVMFGVTFLLFNFYHDFTDCLLKLLITKWCIGTIIVVNKSFENILKLFVFFGGHARSFIRHVNSVQSFLPHSNILNIGTSSETEFSPYSASLFASFCMLWLLWKYSDLYSSVEHSMTMMSFDSSLSVY